MSLANLVRRICGPIEPIGQHSADEIRFTNLKEYCLLAEEMVRNIRDVAKNRHSYEGSVKRAGEFAARSLEEIREYL